MSRQKHRTTACRRRPLQTREPHNEDWKEPTTKGIMSVELVWRRQVIRRRVSQLEPGPREVEAIRVDSMDPQVQGRSPQRRGKRAARTRAAPTQPYNDVKPLRKGLKTGSCEGSPWTRRWTCLMQVSTGTGKSAQKVPPGTQTDQSFAHVSVSEGARWTRGTKPGRSQSQRRQLRERCEHSRGVTFPSFGGVRTQMTK